MNIGFDAKRAYHNHTGLGHYSRTLIHSLAQQYPEHEYFLFNPQPSFLFSFAEKNVHEALPEFFLHKIFSSAWRSSWVKKDLGKRKIDLYHGLSHEIPLGIHHTGIKSVVTIHDLIHERYPQQYRRADVEIYRSKFRYACRHADHVIAISRQTKQDIIDFYKIAPEKISVCYQSCNPAFGRQATAEEKENIRSMYHLPQEFFLYVGSVTERKNLLNICKALFLLRNEMNVPLVVIGEGKKYMEQVKDYISQNNLQEKIIFLSEHPQARSRAAFQTAADFPAIYQCATAMIYPSFFEGFGIPVLEALWSRLPVITSNLSCLPETGGAGAHYINPVSAEGIAEAMKKIYADKNYAEELRDKGWQHAQQFTAARCTAAVIDVYNNVMSV